MIPSRQQWKRWSLPSKYTAVGLVIAVAMTAIALLGWISILVTGDRHARAIHYEIVSVEPLTRAEARSKNIDGFPPFDFKLDDPVVERYFLYRIRLKNKGPTIDQPLKFTIQLPSVYTKILDFQQRLRSPQHKTVTLISSLPNLRWVMPDKRDDFTLSWGGPDDSEGVVGFNLYTSLLPTRGFGRLNPSLLEATQVTIPWSGGTRYFAVTAVNDAGLESKRTSPVRLPEHLAFLPSFEDVYWVDPTTDIELPDGSRLKPYSTLAELLEAHLDAKAALTERSTIVGMGPEKLQILTQDDLSFLKGRLDMTISGLDERAEVELAVLAKSVSEEAPKLLLTFKDAPGVTISEGAISSHKAPELLIQKNARASITPDVVVTRSTKSAVVLQIQSSADHSVNWVRVFRSTLGVLGDIVEPSDKQLGKEIYDGPLMALNLRCSPKHSGQKQASQEHWWRGHMKGVIRPPSRHHAEQRDPPAPKAPNLVTVQSSQHLVSTEPRYIVDADVDSDVVYRYTIFVEAEAPELYSYPITTFAASNAPDPLLCELVE